MDSCCNQEGRRGSNDVVWGHGCSPRVRHVCWGTLGVPSWVPSTVLLPGLGRGILFSAGSCRDQEGRRVSDEVVPGTSVFSSSENGMSGNFCLPSRPTLVCMDPGPSQPSRVWPRDKSPAPASWVLTTRAAGPPAHYQLHPGLVWVAPRAPAPSVQPGLPPPNPSLKGDSYESVGP